MSPFAPERLLASDNIRRPNPDCPSLQCSADSCPCCMSRATRKSESCQDFSLQLGMEEEFVVQNQIGVLYDVDETENLNKKLSELGMLIDQIGRLLLSDNTVQALKVTAS